MEVSAPADGVEPEAFLSAAPSGSRGFWQRGGRWIAHAGRIGQVEVGSVASEGRWSALRRGAAALFSRWEGSSGRPPRLYGGLAFEDAVSDIQATSRALPVARFVMPALELESGPEGRVLRAWGGVEPGAGREAVERQLRRRIDAALGRTRGTGRVAGVRPIPSGCRHLTDRSGWAGSVRRLLARIDAGEIEKVVLARALEVRFRTAPDPLHILAGLRRRNPRAWPFLFEPRAGATVVGAGPELLVATRGGRFRTMAVAGTTARGAGREEDERLARRLAGSEKDRAEHGIGVRELRERLDGVARDLRIDPRPRLLRLSGVHHLRTDVRGLLPPGGDVLSLVERLHPTAAVCGHPRDLARRLLRAEEPVERGWYAGPVGWFDALGDGVFVPVLRAAVVLGDLAHLHAGAGIVHGSRADEEWDETGVKLRTVLDALGLGAEEGTGGSS